LTISAKWELLIKAYQIAFSPSFYLALINHINTMSPTHKISLKDYQHPHKGIGNPRQTFNTSICQGISLHNAPPTEERENTNRNASRILTDVFFMVKVGGKLQAFPSASAWCHVRAGGAGRSNESSASEGSGFQPQGVAEDVDMLERMVPVLIKSGNFQMGPKMLVHGKFDWKTNMVLDVVQSTSSYPNCYEIREAISSSDTGKLQTFGLPMPEGPEIEASVEFISSLDDNACLLGKGASSVNFERTQAPQHLDSHNDSHNKNGVTISL